MERSRMTWNSRRSCEAMSLIVRDAVVRLASIGPLPLSICLISLLIVPLTSPAQPGGLTGGLTDRAEDEVIENGSTESAPDVSCPDWDETGTCGRGAPPERFLPGPLDGIWDVSAPGAPHVAELIVIMNSRLGRFHRGSPSLPSPAQAIWRLQDQEQMDSRPFAVSYSALDGGSFRVSMGRFELCDCVQIHFRVYPTDNPDVLRGEWEYEDQRGPTQWRRRDAPRVRAVSISDAVLDDDGQLATDFYAVEDRAGTLHRPDAVTCGYGQMRGNCPSIDITVLGENFAGPHQVWIDPATFMEIGTVGWVCRNGDFHKGGWFDCGYDQEPTDRVAGIRMQVRLRDGMKSGPVNLWVNGRPLPIDVQIDGSPNENSIPRLLSLSAFDSDDNAVTRLQENGVYRFEAEFAEQHSDAWIAIELSTSEAGDDGHAREITLTREADRRTFSSKWLQLRRADSSEVPQ